MTKDKKELNEYLNALRSFPLRNADKAAKGCVLVAFLGA